jgi:hypothetical protein
MLFKTLRKGVLARFIVVQPRWYLRSPYNPYCIPASQLPSITTRCPRPLFINTALLQSCPKPRLLIPPASRFSEGLASVRIVTPDTHRVGYIDPSGRVVIQPQFDYADDFSEGLAAVTIGTKSGYIDKTGRLVIQPLFTSASAFSDGLAQVRLVISMALLIKRA